MKKKIWQISIICLLTSCAGGFMLFDDIKDGEEDSNLSNASLNLKVNKYQLKNGLRLLVVENHRLPIFSYYTFFDVGGRYESRKDKTTGATHFLEHLMFKGTHKTSSGYFDRVIEARGGHTNAYTTFDATVYYNNVPSGNLSKIIEMEADRMNNLKIEENPFEKERLVVLEERKLRYENRPAGKLHLAMMQEVFKGTPYGGSVIGSKEDLLSLTKEQVEKFYQKFYTPDNAIIVVTGDVNSKKVHYAVKKYYGSLAPSKDLAKFKKEKNAPENYSAWGRFGREIKLNGATPVPIFNLVFKGEPLGTRKSFVMDILSSILGAGDSSYLKQKFVKGKKHMLNSLYVYNYNLKYKGVFYIGGKLLKGIGVNQFKRTLVKETGKICKKAINERSLQKTKNQYLIHYYNSLQTNAGSAEFLGLREGFYNDYNFYKKELLIYDSIQVEEVKKVCHEIFDKGEYIFLSIWRNHPKKS